MQRRHIGGLGALTSAALTLVLAAASSAVAAPSATTVTASPASAAVGSPVQLTASVSCGSDPGGGLGVSFFDGGDLLDTVPVAGGVAAYSTVFTASGSHTITAAYNGNDACDASSATVTVTVSPAAPPPSTPPSLGLPGLCLLACGGGIGFTVGDIRNHVDVR
ncbi:Ig-like domain-containing protein [Streptomyces broussonetiae]|uniref:Ig-like domain-containing protein n=1 Tax=Streptomyces broussonetiae TaxID=2686304 RepID=A0ABV5EDE8_9ACTN